jgi:hypothetical protein
MFVLTALWAYEGEAVLGVYATQEDAIAAAQTEDAITLGDQRLVYEVPVGQPAYYFTDPLWASGMEEE